MTSEARATATPADPGTLDAPEWLRLAEIGTRLDRITTIVIEFGRWMNEASTIEQESDEAVRLLLAANMALAAAGKTRTAIGEMIRGRLAGVDALASIEKGLAAAQAGLNQVLGASYPIVRRETNRLAALALSLQLKRRLALGGYDVTVDIFTVARTAAIALANDRQWVARWLAEISLPEIKGSKDRMKRLRARRKAGFRLATVAVHESDLELLHKLRLLGSDPDQGEIDDAVNMILSGAMTAAHSAARPLIAGLESAADPASETYHNARVPELRAAPLLEWLDRVGAWVKSML